MPESLPAHLATTRRGTALEAVVRGHVAVVDASGMVVAGAGDPDNITTVRSCVKPLQALPFVRHAAGPLGASSEELALACSSHSGEPVHVRGVLGLLRRIGLDEDALSCGPQPPMDQEAAASILAAGERPGRIHNNCSGKHAGMLAVCAVRGWPIAGYAAAAHPLQGELRATMGGLGGIDLDSAPAGIDGCGLPTFGVPLRTLGRMFAAATADAGFRRCQEAMSAHPHLVAGRGRFDTALLAAAGRDLTVKGGAAAVWVAVRRPRGPALAIKLEAGDQTAVPAIALAALQRLGWIGAAALEDAALGGFAHPTLRNWEGTAVGSITVEPAWIEGLAA
ncbi:MAG: asparaginase [Candidatus Dormibacteria bacterium]